MHCLLHDDDSQTLEQLRLLLHSHLALSSAAVPKAGPMAVWPMGPALLAGAEREGQSLAIPSPGPA